MGRPKKDSNASAGPRLLEAGDFDSDGLPLAKFGPLEIDKIDKIDKGAGGETDYWIARFQKLPAYLGQPAASPTEAVALLEAALRFSRPLYETRHNSQSSPNRRKKVARRLIETYRQAATLRNKSSTGLSVTPLGIRHQDIIDARKKLEDEGSLHIFKKVADFTNSATKSGSYVREVLNRHIDAMIDEAGATHPWEFEAKLAWQLLPCFPKPVIFPETQA